MDITDEQALSGNLTAFEAYMFSTTERHMERHQSFSRFGIGIAADGHCVQYGPEQAVVQKFRSSKLREFNKVLKDHGFDHIKPGRKFANLICYLEEDEDDLDDILQAISSALETFSAEQGAVCAYCVHADQMDKSMSGIMPVHIHIMYAVKKRQDNMLLDYLLSD